MATPSNPGYETIPNSEGEHSLEVERSGGVSGSSSDNDSSSDGKNIKLIASSLVLLLLAFIGGRRSTGGAGYTISLKDGQVDFTDATTIPTRLCEIYHNPKETSDSDAPSSKIRMIQTSLSEPSKQWSEIPCVYRTSSSSSTNNRKLHPDDTSNPISTETEDGGYSSPSAIINVDFTKVPFKERQPILGFGGAFTEAAALNFGSLSKEGKDVALELLFGRNGLGYT